MPSRTNDEQREKNYCRFPVQPKTPLFRMLQIIARQVAKKLVDTTSDNRRSP